MSVKKKFKDFMYNNPFAKHRRKKMRARLKNRNMSFFVPSCIGGELFHDLGLQFRSPTINTMIYQTHFVRFITHYDEYMQKPFVFYTDPENPKVPCAHLGDVDIHFTHYKTPEEAERKWKERAARVDWDNAFVFCSDRDGITDDEIRSLKKLNVRGVVVFSARRIADAPYVLYIPDYKKYGETTDLQKVNHPFENRNYEKYFDWVKWFNEANGAPYDIKPYSLVKKNG